MNLSHMINQLIEEKESVERLISRLQDIEKHEMEGKLSWKYSKGKIQCYKRLDIHERNGQYIRKSEIKTIKGLVQKRYNHVLKDFYVSKLDAINKCIEILRKTDTTVQTVLDSIPNELHRYVKTDVFSNTDSVEEWENEVVVGSNPIKAEKTYVASDGTCVRSKSELIIAEALIACKVPFFYERPFFQFLGNGGRGVRNLYPDFTCLNRRTGKTYYWEHLGMMDNPDYATKNVRRIMEYAKEGVYPGSELILSFEAEDVPLRTDYIRAVIKKYLL